MKWKMNDQSHNNNCKKETRRERKKIKAEKKVVCSKKTVPRLCLFLKGIKCQMDESHVKHNSTLQGGMHAPILGRDLFKILHVYGIIVV